MTESDFEPYYKVHLAYFLEGNPGEDETFFRHVHDVVVNRIKYFKRLDPFSKRYVRGHEPTQKLEMFLDFLKTIDRWHKTEPLDAVIGEKDNLIDKLKQRIEELEAQLKQASKFDAGEKIVISKSGLSAFMNLIHQFQDLSLPNGNKLTRSQTQSPWYKMIAKYFIHGDKDISIDTARNYFPAQKEDKPAKFIEIAEKDKLFKI
ncbi:MAG TPA: hypothetical protein VHB54_14350 [Mucilaginibacter sp.]|nr:hypothetical protein [Mucilaginibacter sp.]